MDQLYAATYPDHPDFDPQRKGDVVRDADLRTTLTLVRKAADAPEGRIEVERGDREALRRIAHPLRLGEEHNGPFVLGRYWADELDRRAAQEHGDGELTVRTVRGWLRDLGMERVVENLVIAVFAELTHRAWMRADHRIDPPETPKDLADDMVLYRQALPSAERWEAACRLAEALTGRSPADRRDLPTCRGEVLAGRAGQGRPGAPARRGAGGGARRARGPSRPGPRRGPRPLAG
ncbi:hypothetical protein K7G98_16995 [Saccharothrix sp. MB29]|nr:hypothetical protein [Saccharothrix sp. MB29]